MVFPCLVIVAETVPQVVAMVFLGIKSLILDRPSSPSGFRQFFYAPFRYRQVCQEIKRVFPLPAFPSLYEVDLVLFIRNPCHIVMPHRFFFPLLSAFPDILFRHQILLFLIIAFQLP